MKHEQLRDYRARMKVANLFRALLNQRGERQRLLQHLGISRMPAIIPALGNTLASEIQETACQYLSNGEDHVIVPVGLFNAETKRSRLCVLIASTKPAETFWQLNLADTHENTQMGQIVEALDPNKKWDVRELDIDEQQALQELTLPA